MDGIFFNLPVAVFSQCPHVGRTTPTRANGPGLRGVRASVSPGMGKKGHARDDGAIEEEAEQKRHTHTQTSITVCMRMCLQT